MSPLIPKAVLWGASVVTRLKYGWWFSEADCRKALARCDRPMLFIHGDEDALVPFEHLWDNYNAKTQGYKEYWAVPGARHAESYVKYPEEYTRRVSAFLNTVHKMIEDGSIYDK
jgi:Hydrolases of the alpha/beta superfamily